MSHFINLEVLHALPLSNSNRDDSGLPKTITFGGTMRGEITSQAIKHASRFRGTDAISGFRSRNAEASGFYRTKYVRNLIESAMREQSAQREEPFSESELEERFKALGGNIFESKKGFLSKLSNTLVVFTPAEIDSIAEAFMGDDFKNVSDEDVQRILAHSDKRDIALWGRFFSTSSEVTFEGSAQVAPAFTTHPVSIQADYFVGMDDGSDLFSDTKQGASHLGNAYFTQGVFYKYGNVNLEETVMNLLNASISDSNTKKNILVDTEYADSAAAVTAEIIENFITSLSFALPQGKIRSMAHTTLPSMIRVSITEGQPVNNANAFIEAVHQTDTNQVRSSVKKLAEYNAQVMNAMLGAPKYSFVLVPGADFDGDGVNVEALGEKMSALPQLLASVKDAVTPLAEQTVETLTTINDAR